jgi:hypothetical protein
MIEEFSYYSIVSEEMRPHFEQNVSDALSIIPQMAVGLDVNVRFGGCVKLPFFIIYYLSLGYLLISHFPFSYISHLTHHTHFTSHTIHFTHSTTE